MASEDEPAFAMTPAAIRLREKKAVETPEERLARKVAHAQLQRERNARLRAARAAQNGSEPVAPPDGAESNIEPLTPEWAARSYIIQQLEKRKRSGGKPSEEDTISTAHLRKLTGWSGADVSKFVQAILDEWETAQRQAKGGPVSQIEAIYGAEGELEEVAA